MVSNTKGIWLTFAVDLSILGMGVHTVREFGWDGLLEPATGFLPVCGFQFLLLFAWWLLPTQRSIVATGLMLTGVFQLIGGAIISVLPLPFLPFAPEQSVAHYISHAFLGLTQLPLILVPFRSQSAQP